MDPRLQKLYANRLKLNPDYVREVLGLDGETAARVEQISGGIHEDEAQLLSALVKEAQPAISVEIGLGYGFSALTICTSVQNDNHGHIAIDPHQSSYWKGQGARNVVDAGFGERFRLVEDYSYKALPALLTEGIEADLVFIDGWHTFDFVFVDFFHADKLLRAGGLVIFDDADWPSIRPVIRYAVTNLGYEVVGVLPEKRERAPIDVELGIEGSCIGLRKPLQAPKREIFFHRNFS